VGQAFLGADGDDGFGIRIELDRIAALVPVTDRLAQARNALGHGIAVRGRARRRFHHLVDDVLGSRAVRIAHRHVDDVFATPTRRHLELAGNVENVRGQTLDAGELPHDGNP
jgi:hypothetical protein